jgi:hypothetical protein
MLFAVNRVVYPDKIENVPSDPVFVFVFRLSLHS